MISRALAIWWILVSISAPCLGKDEEKGTKPLGQEPVVLGHRGMVCLAPENSIASIREALAVGADGSEIDVYPARSGEVVVLHDPMIDRVTGAKGWVAEMDLEEIRSHTLKPDPGGRYTHEKIPTLEELLKLFGGKAVLFIHMKRPQGMVDANDGMEDRIGELIDRYGLHDTTFVSFSREWNSKARC